MTLSGFVRAVLTAALFAASVASVPGWSQSAHSYAIATVAGGHLGDGRLGIQARIAPYGVTLDGKGNVYIADGNNHRIRKLDLTTGIIATVAGNGVFGYTGDGGPATAATLDEPRRVALDSAGRLYIADFRNCRVRRVDPASGLIDSVVGNGACQSDGDGGPAMDAGLNYPRDVALDAQDNLYIAEVGRIRKVPAATGIIQTLAGTGEFGYSGDGGPATAAALSIAEGIAVDASGNVYFADVSNQRVRRVDAATGTIQTVAGTWPRNYENNGDGGPATSASLFNPSGVAVDAQGNLFIADTSGNRVRKVSATTGLIETVAGGCPSPDGGLGDGGAATAACLNSPWGVGLDANGDIYIADTGNGRVRLVQSGVIATVAGNGNPPFDGDGGPARFAWLDAPIGLALDTGGNLHVADNGNRRVRRIDTHTGLIDTILVVEYPGPSGLAFDSVGDLYVAAYYSLLKRAQNTGAVITIAGSGTGLGDGMPASQAALNGTQGIAVDASQNLYLSHFEMYGSGSAVLSSPYTGPPPMPTYANSRIRQISGATGIISTLAGATSAGFSGDGGPATSALLSMPVDVATDKDGKIHFVDYNNWRIRRIDPATGLIDTVAGNGTWQAAGDGGLATASGMIPAGLAFDAAGNLYIADQANGRIRRVDAVTGRIETIAGGGLATTSPDFVGPALSAVLQYPQRLTVDKYGVIYFTEGSGGRIRKLTPMVVPTAAPVLTGATPGDGRIVLSFTAPVPGPGGIAGYLATCIPAGGGPAVTGAGTVAPITVYGLANGVAYTCSVQAYNETGPGPASAASASVTPAATPNPMTLRDAIYLYGQTLSADGDKVLVGADCDVFQLVLDVTSGHTRLAMGQAGTLANALAGQTPYVDAILGSDAMFAYALYQDQAVKTFSFNDPGQPPAAQIGTATAFGYCYSTKPGARVYLQQRAVCTNTYSDGHTAACAPPDNGSGMGGGGDGSLVLRDAIYLYDQDFNGRGDKALAGENCDVFQLVLDVEYGYTDLAMAQASDLDAAVAAQSDYVDRIVASADMFAYALYENQATKAFVFKDKAAPASSSKIGRGTVFGYCYSADPNARVYLRARNQCLDTFSNGQTKPIAGCTVE